MPVNRCQENGDPGYRWGQRGKCYTYSSGDENGRRQAKRKAILQGVASGERPASEAAVFDAQVAAGVTRSEQRDLPEMISLYQAALTEIARTAAKMFAIVAAADWQPPVEGALLSLSELERIVRNLSSRLEPLRRRVVVNVPGQALAQIEISWDVTHPLAVALLNRAGERTGPRLAEAAQFMLRETLAHAYNEGLNVRDTANLIRAAMRAEAPARAEMLARTDLNSLANGASAAAARTAGMGFKTWVATLDARTRPEHADANGQTVAINDTFTVGGEDAQYPGDPNLSDDMACNCRCSLVFGGNVDEAEALMAGADLLTAEGGSIMTAMKTRARRRKAAPGKGKAIVAGAQGGNFPLGPRDETWDANAAEGSYTLPADANHYMWRDPSKPADQRNAYKLPFVTGDHANWGAITAIANRLGNTQIPDADKAAIRTKVSGYYAKARAKYNDDSIQPPWNNAAHLSITPKKPLMAAARSVRFAGTAAIEGILSDDSSAAPRVLLTDSLEWPEMPVSFMAQTATAEGHDGAQVAGRIDSFARQKKMGKVRYIAMAGELTTPFGINEVAPMIDDETMRYVSVDLGAAEWAVVTRDTFTEVPPDELNMDDLTAGKYALGLTSGKIKAATLVPTQAIPGAMVALTASADGDEATLTFPVVLSHTKEEQAIVAAATPKLPPREWFETQEPPGKMPLTVTKDGRVYGHLATWDSCHVGFLPSCVPPPKSPTNYARFHVGELDTDGGPIMVGKLMFSEYGGHADRRINASKASEYYDKTGMLAACLRVSDGKHGIWACGSLNPDLDEEQKAAMRRKLRLNPPSGDWRPMDGSYELICALAVPVPGFPVPRATITVTASAQGVELAEAIIASSGWFDPDPAALAALEHIGLDEDVEAERRILALGARAQGIDALGALID